MSDRRFMVNAIQWDDDGVVTIVYMDREDALRDRGNMFRATTLSFTPESSLAPDLDDILDAVKDVLAEATEVYRVMPPWVPEDVPDEDEEGGMGF